MAAQSGAPHRALRFVLKAGRRAFSHSQGAAAPLSAQQLAEKIRAEKQEQKKKQAEVSPLVSWDSISQSALRREGKTTLPSMQHSSAALTGVGVWFRMQFEVGTPNLYFYSFF